MTASAPLRLLVIQHEADAPPAWFGQWWTEAGLVVEIVRGDLAHPIPSRIGEHDGLVVLGGAMGANDDEDYDWLTPTKALIADTVERGIPTLGICLGHQLAATALGGSVGRNPTGRAISLTRVGLTPQGDADPLLTGLDGGLAIHYNDDVVLDAPPGSTVLAHAPDGSIQALRLGPVAWGLQFHPEATPEVFDDWLTEYLTDDPQVPAWSAEVGAAREALQTSWRPIADRYAVIVATTAATRRASA